MAAGGTITATHETLLWQRERLYNGGKGGSTMAAREALSSRQRIKRDPRETVSRWHARLHHGSRKMPIIAADSILQGEGETISRRHERGCVLSGRGRAYHGVTRDSLCPIEAGEPIMAARVIRCLSCHEGKLYHGGKRASMSIVAASIDWQHCPAGMPWVCGHFPDRGLW